MDGLGQAIPELSRMSVHASVYMIATRKNQCALTQRGMLERKGHEVLDPLERRRKRVSQEALADDNPNTVHLIDGIPEALAEDLVSKSRESEWKTLAILGKV
jgi:hypothetical protein